MNVVTSRGLLWKSSRGFSCDNEAVSCCGSCASSFFRAASLAQQAALLHASKVLGVATSCCHFGGGGSSFFLIGGLWNYVAAGDVVSKQEIGGVDVFLENVLSDQGRHFIFLSKKR